jgi:hypothetical protein
MKRISALALALGAGLLMGLSVDTLRQDMVMLDKVYIAALALTNQGKAAESRMAISRLAQAWEDFSARHRGANPGDAQWQKDFDTVAQSIRDAAGIAASDRNLLDAHEALEQVRFVMLKLRTRNGIQYFGDRLTEFHEPMEAIALAAKDKTAEALADGDIARIRSLLAEAGALWRGVMNAPFDADTYRLEPQQYEQARKLMQHEQQALAQLEAALGSGDKASIIKAAAGIKPPFAALYTSFGDFRPYRR